jgi:hypothetical protein
MACSPSARILAWETPGRSLTCGQTSPATAVGHAPAVREAAVRSGARDTRGSTAASAYPVDRGDPHAETAARWRAGPRCGRSTSEPVPKGLRVQREPAPAAAVLALAGGQDAGADRWAADRLADRVSTTIRGSPPWAVADFVSRPLTSSVKRLPRSWLKRPPRVPTQRMGRTDRPLYGRAFTVDRWEEEQPPEVKAVLDWFERKSKPTSALADKMLARKALDALTLTTDGGTAASSTIRRKRAISHNSRVYAVDTGLLTENPISQCVGNSPIPSRKRSTPRASPTRRKLRNYLPASGPEGPRGRLLVAFFGCIYYAGARPAEVVGLRREDCTLPHRGWGDNSSCPTRAHGPAPLGGTTARPTTVAG